MNETEKAERDMGGMAPPTAENVRQLAEAWLTAITTEELDRGEMLKAQQRFLESERARMDAGARLTNAARLAKLPLQTAVLIGRWAVVIDREPDTIRAHAIISSQSRGAVTP